MKKIETIKSGENFAAINVGKFAELGEHVLQLAPGVEIPGKVFGGQAIGATGGEFSFQLIPAGVDTNLKHQHKNHEELYFFLAGNGEYEVDGEKIPVEQGSVVRVSPKGVRTVRNNGTEPLVMLCVQYRGGTLTAEDADDAIML